MTLKKCSKLKNGSMSYEIDEATRSIRLVEDIPKTGDSGAWFDSKTEVPFDKVNEVLQQKSEVSTRDFVNLFNNNTANNGPMLVAALVNEDKLSIRNKRIYSVHSML